MDLRILKTKKNIRETFLQLRSKNNLEKVKVTELCELAAINKTTFYKHYQDIFALSEEIENEIIEDIMNNFDNLNSLLKDPDKFIKGFNNAIKPHEKLLQTLFYDRTNVILEKFEKKLKSQYLSPNNTIEEDITISFIIGGASRVMMDPKYDESTTIKIVHKILVKVLNI